MSRTIRKRAVLMVAPSIMSQYVKCTICTSTMACPHCPRNRAYSTSSLIKLICSGAALPIVSLQFRCRRKHLNNLNNPTAAIRLVVSASDRILKSKMFVFQIHDLNISATDKERELFYGRAFEVRMLLGLESFVWSTTDPF